MTGDYRIEPLTPQTWNAFAALAERHNGIFGGCWCTWFHDGHPSCEGRGETYEGNRVIKQRLVEEGVAHAALVFDGDEAVAWCEYGTPEELPNLHHHKQYVTESDVTPDYKLTCIFVDKRYRRQGLTEVALHGALDLIAQAGGGVVEGYPHQNPEKRVSSSFLYNATRSVYERAGFDFIRPKGMKNTVMRRTVAGSQP